MSQTKEITIIAQLLKELHLPAIRECFAEKAQEAVLENLSHEAYLCEVLQIECAARHQRSIERRLRESKLPLEKTFLTFDAVRFDRKVNKQIEVLRDGAFLKRKENILVFGPPGVGKTHLLIALGHEFIKTGHKVLFVNCSLFVQELLRAKADLKLERLINKLLAYEALIIDDLGYVQQSREEMEVLFTLLAARYERGSVLLTSNLAFSKWECIFKDPMTTAAAIDRLVHHSVILELNVNSYRMEQAKKNTTDEQEIKNDK